MANVGGNVAMAATAPCCSYLHREVYVKAVTAESLSGAEDSAFCMKEYGLRRCFLQT